MIQRIQTIYLLIAAVMMAIFLFVPFAQFFTPDALYRFDAMGIQTIGDPATALSTSTWGAFILIALTAIISFIAIFMYNNRPLQMKMCIINVFFLITVYIVIFLYILTVKDDLQAESIVYSPYLIFPLVALMLDSIAFKAILKDEKLIRAADRIR